MKTVSVDLRYDGASAEQVYAMLADPAFRERVCDAQGVLRHEVSVTPSGEGMSVRIEQDQAAQGIPSFAKKFVGETITIVQAEEWSSPTAATVEVSIPGKPGDMRGTVAIAEDATGTTESVRLDVRVGIPLVGGKLESLVADLLSKALHAEQRTGREWLAG